MVNRDRLPADLVQSGMLSPFASPTGGPPSGRPDGAAFEGLKALAALYPKVFAPLDAYPFVRFTSIVTVGAGAVTVMNVTIGPIAHSQRGIITRLGQSANDFSTLTWVLLRRGIPADPFTSVVGQFGTIAAPTEIPGPGLFLTSEDDLRIQVTNTGGAPVTGVQVVLHGYIWRVP